MLDNQIVKEIEDFVVKKPRAVQEIAQHINKSWRTADRYVEEIEKEFGTITTRTFREGTRGALKIVFWTSAEKKNTSVFQDILENQILLGRRKEDFSAFDIFQHIKDKEKHAHLEKSLSEDDVNLSDFMEIIANSKKQVLIFSGNLSFINSKKINFMKELENLVKKNVSIKIICRVDVVGIKNIEKLLSLNFKYGKELIEIHHKEQPIRAILSDNKLFGIKEIKEQERVKGVSDKQIVIFYTLKDKEWAEWLSRIFWKLFSSSIDANKRLEEINKIKIIT